MSAYGNDPRVTEIDGGYRVINDEFRPVKAFRDRTTVKEQAAS